MGLTMLNKTIAFLLVFLLAFPSYVLAEPPEEGPKVHSIKKNEKAPFAGVLFNSVAAAEVLAEKSYFEKECELKINFQVNKEKARLQALIDSQKVSYESLENRYGAIIKIKDQEIERLSSIALNTNDYSTLWATGGILAGIGLTLAVMYAIER